MSKRRADMTPAEHARADASNARRRSWGQGNPTYRLTDAERVELAYMGHLRLWTKASLAALYGVTTASVRHAMERNPRRVSA